MNEQSSGYLLSRMSRQSIRNGTVTTADASQCHAASIRFDPSALLPEQVSPMIVRCATLEYEIWEWL